MSELIHPCLRQLLRAGVAMLFVLAANDVNRSAFAQGTATGPATSHDVTVGPIVLIGDDMSPIPIDLDPNGPPWSKGIFDSNLLFAGGGLLDIVETIENVGTEPWYDWHEEILFPPAGLPPSTWDSVVSMSVNGGAITFDSMGEGTQELWLDNFSQPVLPGDVLTIHKLANVPPNDAGMTGSPLLRILEFPTTIPEPTSLALCAVSGLWLLGCRRIC